MEKKCGVCEREADYFHTYYSLLSLCDEHYQKKIKTAQENGRKGGRPKKIKTL